MYLLLIIVFNSNKESFRYYLMLHMRKLRHKGQEIDPSLQNYKEIWEWKRSSFTLNPSF